MVYTKKLLSPENDQIFKVLTSDLNTNPLSIESNNNYSLE